MDEKQKALEQVLGQIEKQYGKGAIMKLGAGSQNLDIEVILVSQHCQNKG